MSVSGSGSGEERTWTIYVCPEHRVLKVNNYCGKCRAFAGEEIRVVEASALRAEREAREKAEDLNEAFCLDRDHWRWRAEKAECGTCHGSGYHTFDPPVGAHEANQTEPCPDCSAVPVQKEEDGFYYCETEGVRTDVRCTDDCGCSPAPPQSEEEEKMPEESLDKIELRLAGAAIAFAGVEFCEARGLDAVGDLLLKLDRMREAAPDPPAPQPEEEKR